MGGSESCQKKAPAATPQDIEKALEKQRKMFERIHEQKLQNFIQDQKNATSTTVGPTPQPPVVSMERQQNAFNQLPTASIYPNLTAGYSAHGSMTAPAPLMNYYAGTSNYVPNNNYYNNPQFTPAPTNSFPSAPPSAPPCDAVVSTRSRSQSRHRDGNSNKDITCVTCDKSFGEKIFQCNQRHNSCHLCKLRQVSCGECRQQITNRRNFPLEKTVSEKRVQCPNSSDGCRLYIKMGDMNIHEKECPFKVMKCPSLGNSCNWSGKLSQLGDHFDEMHPLHNQCDVDKEMLISNITNTSHTMHYIQIGSLHFLLHVKVSQPNSKIYMVVQLIGTKHSAAKWEYEIHMFKKSEPRRKFQYFDQCSSNVVPVDDIIKNGTCAVIPQEYAKTFLCNGNVIYKCYIKRVEDKVVESEVGDGKKERPNTSRPRRNNFKKYVKKNRPVSGN